MEPIAACEYREVRTVWSAMPPLAEPIYSGSAETGAGLNVSEGVFGGLTVPKPSWLDAYQQRRERA
jgi:hypothetical protein